MKRGAKIALGVIAGAGIFYLFRKGKQAATAEEKIFVDMQPVDAYRDGSSLVVVLNVSIENLSNVSLTLNNLWTRLQYLKKDNTTSDFGRGQAESKSIRLVKGQTVSFQLPLKIAGLSAITGLFSATGIQAITNFNVMGASIDYPNKIDLTKFKDLVKSKIGLSGTDNILTEVNGIYQLL